MHVIELTTPRSKRELTAILIVWAGEPSAVFTVQRSGYVSQASAAERGELADDGSLPVQRSVV